MESPSKVFAWEPLEGLLDDGLADLVRQHWDEVGIHKAEMPLAVDWERYADLERLSILYTMGARINERLVGYASYMVMPHLHYSKTLHAGNDAIYVLPPHRGLGVRLIDEAEKALTDIATQRGNPWLRITYHTKFHVEEGRGTVARVFERRGYHAFEATLDKMVRAAWESPPA